MDAQDKSLNFLESFISKHYLKQHPLVRGITFLLFVFLLTHSLYRIAGGEYVVRGRVLTAAPGAPKEPAKNYDIRLGERFFGTNSKGIYHVILSPLEYAGLVAVGKLQLEVLKGDTVVRDSGDVQFQRFSQMFVDIVTTGATQARIAPGNPFAAWAATPSDGRRLIVYSVLFRSGQPDTKSGTLELDLGGRASTLLATRTGGTPAGDIPLLAGEWLRYGGDYYFEPPRSASLQGGQVRLVSAEQSLFGRIAQTVGLSGHAETFRIAEEMSEGQIVTLKGDRGSELQILLARRYQVVLFGKGDLGETERRLKEELVRSGFLAQNKLAPLGYGQTNALFAGRAVPFTAVQTVLKVASRERMAIKTVQYQLQLRSGNQYEIQLGESRQCAAAPPIAPAVLEELIGARDESEFAKRVQPLQSCLAQPPRVLRRR